MRPLHHRMLRLAPVALLFASATAVSAQSNTISILQDGSGNTLTVDQSDATGSTVGGLTISAPRTQTFYREEKRTVSIEAPDGTMRTEERSFFVPESVEIVDFSLQQDGPVRQSGDNNRASVTITGDNGFVGLLQDNSGSAGRGNFASVRLDGNGEAVIGQEGDGNGAQLLVRGLDAEGSILQKGSGNTAGLQVVGDFAFGSIMQVGNNNESTLAVQGQSGSSVSYTLNGSNVTSFNPAQGVEVVTNAQNVTITQTAITGR